MYMPRPSPLIKRRQKSRRINLIIYLGAVMSATIIDADTGINGTGTSTVASFAYHVLEPEKAGMLKAAAERIRNLFRASVVEVGQELIAVKQKIGDGLFGRWIAHEFSMSTRSAQNYMAAARLLIAKNATVAYLPAKTLYKLGSTSPRARDDVIGRLERGEQLSPKEIAEQIQRVRNEERLEADNATKKEQQNARRRGRAKRQEKDKRARDDAASQQAEAAAAFDEVVGILRQSLSPEDAQRILDLAWVIERDCYRICSLISVARALAGLHNDASRNGAEQAARP